MSAIFCYEYIICRALVDCLVAPATCGAIAECLCIHVASSLPCSRLTVASPSPRPPFRSPLSSSRPPSPPHEDSDGDGDRHWHRRPLPLSLPVLLPPLTLLFPPPSPLPPLPMSGCVRCAGRSGGTATPAVIHDRPDGRTTETRYGTASAAALAAAVATEEGGCDGCNSANPRCRLDDSLPCLADGILLRSIVVTTVPRRGGGGVWRPRRHRCLRSTSARCSLGRRIRRAMTAAALRRRMTATPTWKRGGTRANFWRSSSANFGKGVLGGGERQ